VCQFVASGALVFLPQSVGVIAWLLSSRKGVPCSWEGGPRACIIKTYYGRNLLFP